MKDKFGYTSEQNKQIDDYLTRPSKSADVKKVEIVLNLRKNTLDALTKYEDGPDLVEEAIRMSSTPVPGYVGGATPDPTVPTRAERIAGQKQLEKLAVQPDSRGVFKKLVAANEKEFKDKRDFNDKRGQRFINKTLKPVEQNTDPRGVAFNPTTQLFTNKDRTVAFKSYDEAETWNKSIGVIKTKYYQDEATPEQVGALAERMERSRQMTGGDGRYDKAIIKKKKPIIKKAVTATKTTASPTQMSFNYNPLPTVTEPVDTRSIEQIIRDNSDLRLRQQQDAYDKQYGTTGIVKLRRPQ